MGKMISIPVEEYSRLCADSTELQDLRAYDGAKAAVAAGHDELVPAEIAAKLISGESGVRIWREYRGFTQSELARISDVNRVQIAQIERGLRVGSVATLKKLAAALGIGLDDLV